MVSRGSWGNSCLLLKSSAILLLLTIAYVTLRYVNSFGKRGGSANLKHQLTDVTHVRTLEIIFSIAYTFSNDVVELPPRNFLQQFPSVSQGVRADRFQPVVVVALVEFPADVVPALVLLCRGLRVDAFVLNDVLVLAYNVNESDSFPSAERFRPRHRYYHLS